MLTTMGRQQSFTGQERVMWRSAGAWWLTVLTQMPSIIMDKHLCIMRFGVPR